MGLSQEEKERFLRALEEDWEFRNAVMGLLGIQELLKGMAELRSTQVEILKVLTELVEKVGKLEERVGKLEDGFSELRDRVDRIDRTLERITAAIEDEANDVVTYYLRQGGINIETGSVRLNSVYEFDIYGTNGQLTIIGEAKTRVSKKMVGEVVARVRNAVNAFPGKFPGRVITVIYSVRTDPEAVEEARSQGIWLLESLKEKTPFPG